MQNNSLFIEDRDQNWRLSNPNFSADQVASLRDNFSKRSDTFSIPGESKIEEEPPKKKRRHKRESGKYESAVETMEQLCKDYPKMLKNPFANLKSDMTRTQMLEALGSSDKIVGMIQCYDYFAPLIQMGLKRNKNREEIVTTKVNLLQVSETLKKLTGQLKSPSKDNSENDGGEQNA